MEVGRPTVMTGEVIRKLEEVFALGGTDGEAIFYAGISKTAFYEYCKENPEFADRKESLKDTPVLAARRTVVKALNDPSHAFKYLEKKKKSEFGNAIDVTGNLTIGQVLDSLENE